MSDPKISSQYVPGIRESLPHSSDGHPEVHRDLDFVLEKLSGQLPLPFGRIHIPEPPEGPCQPDFDPGFPDLGPGLG